MVDIIGEMEVSRFQEKTCEMLPEHEKLEKVLLCFMQNWSLKERF